MIQKNKNIVLTVDKKYIILIIENNYKKENYHFNVSEIIDKNNLDFQNFLNKTFSNIDFNNYNCLIYITRETYNLISDKNIKNIIFPKVRYLNIHFYNIDKKYIGNLKINLLSDNRRFEKLLLKFYHTNLSKIININDFIENKEIDNLYLYNIYKVNLNKLNITRKFFIRNSLFKGKLKNELKTLEIDTVNIKEDLSKFFKKVEKLHLYNAKIEKLEYVIKISKTITISDSNIESSNIKTLQETLTNKNINIIKTYYDNINLEKFKLLELVNNYYLKTFINNVNTVYLEEYYKIDEKLLNLQKKGPKKIFINNCKNVIIDTNSINIFNYIKLTDIEELKILINIEFLVELILLVDLFIKNLVEKKYLLDMKKINNIKINIQKNNFVANTEEVDMNLLIELNKVLEKNTNNNTKLKSSLIKYIEDNINKFFRTIIEYDLNLWIKNESKKLQNMLKKTKHKINRI